MLYISFDFVRNIIMLS